jgi:hypothetical protein
MYGNIWDTIEIKMNVGEIKVEINIMDVKGT